MKSKIISYSCLLIVVLFQGAIFSVETYCITLEEIISIAIKNDAQLKADQYAAEVKTADGWKYVADYGPTVDFSGSYTMSKNSSNPDGEEETENRSAYINEPEITISFKQPLVDMEKVANVMKGIAEMSIGDFRRKAAMEDLLLRVHERYYNILSSRERVRLAQAESTALRSQLDAANEKLQLGFGTITDKYNAEARYRLSLASEVSSQTRWRNDLKSLEEILNQHVDEKLQDIDPGRDLPDLPNSLDHWLKIARQKNTDLNLKQLQFRVANMNYRAAQSGFLPSLVFFADYSQRSPDDGLLGYGEERTEIDIGLRVDMNLLDGGRDAAEIVVASKRKKGSREEVTASLRALERSVSSLWDSISGTKKLIGSYYLASEANRLAMESTRTMYDEGVKVLLDVLNAQQDYYKSLREYRTTRYDYLLLIEKFKIVVGVKEIVNV